MADLAMLLEAVTEELEPDNPHYSKEQRSHLIGLKKQLKAALIEAGKAVVTSAATPRPRT